MDWETYYNARDARERKAFSQKAEVEGCRAFQQPPSNCEECGASLEGGATVHRPGCPWLALLADFQKWG